MDKPEAQSFKTSSPLMAARGLWKWFNGEHSRLEVLKALDFDMGKGETIAIIGPSGIGKSTLLHILGALDRPVKGEVLFKGKSLFTLSSDELAAFRNRSIGFIFQFHHLLPEFTALENTMMPLLISGRGRKKAAADAESLLTRVGLEHRLTHRVSQLSGGEQQRVAIARALVRKPDILLADEPTGNLDKKNSEQIHEMLSQLNEELGMTIVTVTHSMALAAYMKRRVTLADGKIQEVAE